MKRLLRRGALIAAPLFLILALLVPRAGAWLVVADPLEKSDAIVVLGGTMYERPLEAIDLLNDGWAPRIYLFREIADWGEVELLKRGVPYTRSVDVQIDAMVRLGVRRDAIQVLDQANSTAEESIHVRRLVTREKYSRVIVVTSKQHTRRARLVMRRRLDGSGTQVIVRPSRYDLSPIDRWWSN
ncbi:MAG TPA: YdcF family protein, partial [Vicinamibacterales bacterium]|nr:YdcF family protein [Vicinamibacterales bacterium]